MDGQRRASAGGQPVQRVLPRDVLDIVAEIVEERGEEAAVWLGLFLGSGNLPVGGAGFAGGCDC